MNKNSWIQSKDFEDQRLPDVEILSEIILKLRNGKSGFVLIRLVKYEYDQRKPGFTKSLLNFFETRDDGRFTVNRKGAGMSEVKENDGVSKVVEPQLRTGGSSKKKKKKKSDCRKKQIASSSQEQKERTTIKMKLKMKKEERKTEAGKLIKKGNEHLESQFISERRKEKNNDDNGSRTERSDIYGSPTTSKKQEAIIASVYHNAIPCGKGRFCERESDYGKQNVEIQCQYSTSSMKIGENYDLHIILQNFSDRTYENLRLKYYPNHYEEECFVNIPILPSQNSETPEISYIIRVMVRNGSHIEDLTEFFDISLLQIESRKVFSSARFKRDLLSFVSPTISSFIPPSITSQMNNYDGNCSSSSSSWCEKYNILVFGKVGAGKSSMVNSFYTLLNEEGRIIQCTNVADHRSGSISTTKTIDRHKFNDKYHFQIVDSWGFMTMNNKETNYDDFRMTRLLDGGFPGKWKLEYTQEIFKEAEEEYTIIKEKKESRRIHSVIFVIQYSDLKHILEQETTTITTTNNNNNIEEKQQEHNNNNNNEFVTFYEMFSKIREVVYNPIIVISRIDHSFPILRKHPRKVLSLMRRKRLSLAEKLHIPINDIYFGINYLEEKRVSFGIDLMNFSILFAALRKAEKNFRNIANMMSGGGIVDRPIYTKNDQKKGKEEEKEGEE